jgi:hypothetical protein
MALHREVNRLFDDMSRGFDQFGMGRFPGAAASRTNWGWPSVEVSETGREIRVTALRRPSATGMGWNGKKQQLPPERPYRGAGRTARYRPGFGGT